MLLNILCEFLKKRRFPKIFKMYLLFINLYVNIIFLDHNEWYLLLNVVGELINIKCFKKSMEILAPKIIAVLSEKISF